MSSTYRHIMTVYDGASRSKLLFVGTALPGPFILNKCVWIENVRFSGPTGALDPYGIDNIGRESSQGQSPDIPRAQARRPDGGGRSATDRSTLPGRTLTVHENFGKSAGSSPRNLEASLLGIGHRSCGVAPFAHADFRGGESDLTGMAHFRLHSDQELCLFEFCRISGRPFL
jgi:hypothetical protein